MSERLLAARLTQLRCSLLSPGFSKVAQQAGLTVEELRQLEEEGTGTATALAALLRFYAQQNINICWLLMPDNARISRVLVDRDSLRSGTIQALMRTYEFEQLWQQFVIQQRVNLTPLPSLSAYTLAELQDYHGQLPPIEATYTGWQSRAIALNPQHFYLGGESTPICGNLLEYLVYDSYATDEQALIVMWQSLAKQARCPHCARQLRNKQRSQKKK